MRPARVLAVYRHPTPYRDPLFDRLAAVPGISLRVLYLGQGFAPTPWEQEPLRHAHAFPKALFTRDVAGMATGVHPGVAAEFVRFRPDVCVLSAWSDPSVLGLMASCRLLDVPYVLGGESFQQSGRSGLPAGPRTAIMEWAIRGAAAWLPAGSRATDHFVRHGAARRRCHPFPTDPDARRWTAEVERLKRDEPGLRADQGLPPDGVVTFVGRLVKDKAPDVLLDAHVRLRAEGRDARLVFVGDGPERPLLEARGVEGVTFRGFLQPREVLRVLAASDVLALPSRYETWGAVACEGLAAGLPIVVSDQVGSASDLAEGLEAARVVPVGDAQALAEALADLLDHPHRRGALAASAKRRASEWGHDLNLRSVLRALADAGLDLAPEARRLALDAGDASGAAPRSWQGERRPVAYVSDGYPKLSETFTLEEVRGLVADGFALEVHALHRPSIADPPLSGQSDPDTAYFPPPAHPAVLASAAWWALRRPVLTARLAVALLSPHTAPWLWRYQLRAPLHGLWGAWLASRLARGAHVHAQFCGSASTVAWVAARLRDATFSLTEHAEWGLPLVKDKLRSATFVVAISEFGRQRLLAAAPDVPEGRVVVNRLGVHLPARPAPVNGQSRTPRLLSVGTLGPKKGHDVLLEACALLRARSVDYHLDLVGEGGERERLEGLVRSRGLDDHVSLLGATAHGRVRELVGECDVFVLACRVTADGDVDGIPVALMEAMAAGRPVVATTVSGLPELVRDGTTGLAVLPDRPDLLAAALERLLSDVALRAQLGEGGRRHVAAEFDCSRTRARLAAIFLKHLGGPGAGHRTRRERKPAVIASLLALARNRTVLLAMAVVLASLATGWGVYTGQRKVLLVILAFTAVVLLRRWAFTDFYLVTITCALLSHVMVPVVQDEFEIYKWRALFVMGGVSLVAILLSVRAPPWPRAIHLLALALVVLSVRSVGWSLDPWHSFQKAGVFSLTLFIAFVGVWCFADSPGRVRDLLDIHVHWLWMVFPLALLSFAIPGVSSHDGAGRLRGPFENPNNLGFWASTTLPLVFAYLMTDERRLVRHSAVVLLCSGTLAAFLAGSRGGMVGAALGIGAYCALRWPRLVAKAGVVAVVFGGFWLAYGMEAGALGDAFVEAFRPGTLANLSDRTISWKIGLMIGGLKPWLGHGFGLGDLLFPLYGFDMFYGHFAPSVHNSFLDTYMNLGLVGVSFLAGIQVLAGWAGLRTWWADRNGRTGLLALGLLCTFVAATAHGAIETIFMSPGTPWTLPYWASAALLVRLRVLQKAGVGWPAPAPGPMPRPIVEGSAKVIPLWPQRGH